MLGILVLTLIVLILCYEFLYDRKSKISAKKLRGPYAYPIIGNGHLFIGSSAKFRNTVEYLFREFGDRTRVFLGPELFVFLSNAEDVEALMKNVDYIEKSRDYDSLRPWLGEGLLTASGQRWKSHRKFITPTFHFSILQEFVPVFEKNSRILAESLSPHSDDNKVFDIYTYISLCALDNICETSMGVVMGAQKNENSEYVEAVTKISALTNYRMRNAFIRNEIFFNISQTKVEQTKILKFLHNFSENVIRNRRKQIEEKAKNCEIYDNLGIKKRTTFLDLLLSSEIEGKKLRDKSIQEEVDTFMFEGHDTTTSAISFTVHLISKHPDIQNKLFKEQADIFVDDFHRDATYTDLNSMKYMELVIKESLRLFPSVPLIGRKISNDTNINGIDLVAGTTILVDVLHLHRNPKLYDNPLEFRPERFEFEEVNKRNPFSWIAFSAGPRNCIGQKFAMLEIKSTLSHLLRNYEFTDAGIEPELSLDLILKPDNGIRLSIQRRK